MPVLTVPVLCAVGLYASAFMSLKGVRASRGELSEPSVVESSRARLLGGVPNSSFGLIYYPCLAVASQFAWAHWASLAASLAAAAMSLVLAHSLLFRTKASCPYCWTAHAVNWTLPVLLCVQKY